MLAIPPRILPSGTVFFIVNALMPTANCQTLSSTSLRRSTSSSSTSSPSSSSSAADKTAANTTTIPALIGSAPQLKRHLVIHTHHDASTWPSHLESTSALYKQLGQRWAKLPQLSKLGFGMSDLGSRKGKGAMDQVGRWDRTTNRFEEPKASAPEEVYSATLYPDFIEVPKISLSSIETFENLFLSLDPVATETAVSATPAPSRRDIYVCTHGTRDCRCGDIGEPLYQKLVERAQRRDLDLDRVRIIGGHKWAGNALVYRQDGECDWLGLLRETDADEVLDYALRKSPITPWWTRWRGRLGIDPDEAKSMYEDATAPGASAETRKKRKETVRDALGDPVQLSFVSWDGVDQYNVTAYEGESVMEAAKRNDLPAILATCGGFCECATCHVHVDVAPEQVGWSEMTDEEDEQLDFAMGRKHDSRLGCQLRVTKALGEWAQSGGRIALPRY
ncbi:BQ2448_1236 [Microbotryum intermedium]|uniref:BQ2448_1236 protein n=1 Tax=Microbotryum intermedium TaxID=269621 RepID=A0A238F7K5_9BASI|nr:BQ2448_1236 [Microbotryum intermedium]